MNGAGVAALLGLLAMAAVGAWLDWRRYGTWLTPFVVLAAPLAAVTLLAATLAPALGFVALDGRVVLLWLPALAVFWGVGWAVLWPWRQELRRRIGGAGETGQQAALAQDEEAYWLVVGLAWLALAVMAVGLQQALRAGGGWSGLESDAFRNVFGRGVFGHATVFCLLALIYLLGSQRLLKPVTLITIAAILAAALIYGVKGWFILPVLAGIFYRASAGRLRITPSLLLWIALLGFGMFLAVYLVRFAADGTRSLADPATYVDLLRHFVAYLFAGVLGFSEFLRQGQAIPGDPLAVVAPFVNLYRFALQPHAPLVQIINPNYLVISPQYSKLSNVPTLVGTLWLYWGTIGMLLYMAVLSAVTHAAFGVAHWRRNCWLLVLWAFGAALLGASWFEMYFWHLTSIEIPVMALLMMAVTAIWQRVQTRQQRSQGK